MALTEAIIRETEALNGLTDDQIKAIEQLSRNDENAVIGARIGELHGAYDKDVLDVTGVAKLQGEKSYDYVKRVLTDYKAKATSADGLTAKITTLESEIAGYKKTIEEGKGNEEIVKQLKDAQKRLSDTQTQYQTEKSAWEKKYNDLDASYKRNMVDAEFNASLQGVKFKSIYPESVQKTLIDAAKRTILATSTPDWVDNNGVKSLVFRDESGNIRTNKANMMNPYTAGELLKEQLKEVIDTGKKRSGTHTTPPTESGDDILDLSACKTQVDADDEIARYLMAKGILRGSAEFVQESQKLRSEYGVDKMKMY